MSEETTTTTAAPASPKPLASRSSALRAVEASTVKGGIPEFRVGDTVKVHVKIREGGKERVQVFQGLVIRRHKAGQPSATFTVRKISYNIGVERTFLLNSPMVEKVEVATVGQVRRARLFYIRELRGKSAKIKSQIINSGGSDSSTEEAAIVESASA